MKNFRDEIDEIDKEMVALFTRRMQIAEQIADEKKRDGRPILDSERERQVLYRVEELSGKYGPYARRLYTTLMEISRSIQSDRILPPSETAARVMQTMQNTPATFPTRAVVACQGAEGAYAQVACDRFFTSSSITYCATFAKVFEAVEQGLCRYGVVPLENSTAGSVNRTYDLLRESSLSIVRSAKIQIHHALLARPGVKLEDIKEVFSHEQALNQCSEYLASLGVKVTPCENTAVAARKVAMSDRTDIAAVASPSCASQYTLAVLKEGIQNNENNYTRFICISKTPEIYPGADRVSLLLRIPHRPGSLYGFLSRFHARGINLLKLESRPVPGSDFTFMFYFDIGVDVTSPDFLSLLSELEAELGVNDFRYLGAYREV